ncbi:MAG TPA: alpha/beta fold hydrolase [Kofleriaceae bacterium]|nr:alpha/beta fold hydrolase [Kofleriaceae bacterium]
MIVREHGPAGPASVVVLHGGPGAPGSAGGLARALADPAHVLEPFQRAGGSVAEHIADLHELIGERCVSLVGHSWGAMLALAYAAEHPVRSVVAVCSGTFDLASRAVFRAALPDTSGLSPREAFAAIDRAYHVDPLPPDPLDATVVDHDSRHGTWNDMLRLQAEGRYPAAFAAITAPVLVVHGADDPHPGAMIRDSLPIPQLVYRELPRCGHYPWHERHARAEFISLVRDFLK